MKMKHWLMKSEPEAYSIQQLKKDRRTWWECVRNYQARNFMQNDMQVGDLVLFYHSNANPSGVAGVAKVCAAAEPDKTQFDKKSEYYDPKATQDKPRWFCVQLEFVEIFKHFVALEELHAEKKLQSMQVLQRGQRLSVQPVSEEHFNLVLKLGKS